MTDANECWIVCRLKIVTLSQPYISCLMAHLGTFQIGNKFWSGKLWSFCDQLKWFTADEKIIFWKIQTTNVPQQFTSAPAWIQQYWHLWYQLDENETVIGFSNVKSQKRFGAIKQNFLFFIKKNAIFTTIISIFFHQRFNQNTYQVCDS